VNEVIAVGGSFGRMGSGGWDAWPIVGIVLAAWIARRMLHIPWGPPLIVASLVSGLVLPPAVHAWGVVPVGGLALLTIAVLRLLRSERRQTPPETV
jgi:hypothetical protein